MSKKQWVLVFEQTKDENKNLVDDIKLFVISEDKCVFAQNLAKRFDSERAAVEFSLQNNLIYFVAQEIHEL